MVALWEESTKFTLLPLKQSWTSVVLNCPNAWMTNISTVNSSRSPDTQKEKSLTPKRRYVLYCSSSFFLLYVEKKITFELKNAKCLTLCGCSLLSVGVKLYWNSSLSLHVFLIVHNSMMALKRLDFVQNETCILLNMHSFFSQHISDILF